jgi:hypothetical protein
LGLEKITLNNFVQDNSASHERLFYGILAQQGLAAPRTGVVDVFVNGTYFGVYLVLESSDEESFLGRSFETSQLLYEGEYGQDLFTGQASIFDEDYGDDPERIALATIISDLNDAPGATLMADTADTIAWDRVIRQMATDAVCGHGDSYTRNRNNFTLHIDDDGRLSLISGGADQSFNEVWTPQDSQGLLMVRCLEDPICATAVDDALAAVAADVDAWLSAGGRTLMHANAETLMTHFADDTRREWDHTLIPARVEAMLTFLEERVAFFSN